MRGGCGGFSPPRPSGAQGAPPRRKSERSEGAMSKAPCGYLRNVASALSVLPGAGKRGAAVCSARPHLPRPPRASFRSTAWLTPTYGVPRLDLRRTSPRGTPYRAHTRERVRAHTREIIVKVLQWPAPPGHPGLPPRGAWGPSPNGPCDNARQRVAAARAKRGER